jgi:phosphomannomutase/phosphoglucomutase
LLDELSQAVEHQGAYLGIAFDGDGDRAAFVDDEGNVLSAEEAAWVLLQSFEGDWADQPFVCDAKFSDKIPEAARRLGAVPVIERSGHAFLRAKMLETGALFGAEVSGHYFFRDLGGGDDGLYAACRLMAFLARSGRTLAELRRQCPPVYTTRDLRIPLPFDEHPAILDRVRRAWSKYPQRDIDGVRIDFPDGWAMVRGSVTEPALTFRFEAADWTSLNELVWRFCDSLPECGDALWADYRASEGATHEPP